MDVCINELSQLNDTQSRRYTLDEINCMWQKFCEVLFTVAKELPGRVQLYSQSGVQSIILVKGFSAAKAMSMLSRDQRQSLYTWISRGRCYASGCFSEDEVYYQDKSVMGFLYAYKLDGLAVSLDNGDAHWQQDKLSVQCYRLNEQAQSRQSEEIIYHASTKEHVKKCAAHFQSVDYVVKQITNRMTLEKNAADFFPYLCFSDTFYTELAAQALGADAFAVIVRKLYRLNNFMSDGTQNWGLLGDYSSEGEQTRKRYKQDREFCFRDQTKSCILHMKNMQYNLRVHFQCDFQNQIAYVGYAGRHLPTVKYSK